MSTGQTGGINLTVETLQYIYDNWEAVALTFDASSDGGFQYDSVQYDSSQYTASGAWQRPVLHDGVEKSTYPDDETAGYSLSPRQNDVVEVGEASFTNDVTGTGFDFDVEAELDVTLKAMPGNGFSVIETSTDWEVFKDIVKRSILTERNRPITDPGCKYDWRWLTVSNGSPTPEAQGNRNLLSASFTVRWSGFESLPEDF